MFLPSSSVSLLVFQHHSYKLDKMLFRVISSQYVSTDSLVLKRLQPNLVKK